MRPFQGSAVKLFLKIHPVRLDQSPHLQNRTLYAPKEKANRCEAGAVKFASYRYFSGFPLSFLAMFASRSLRLENLVKSGFADFYAGCGFTNRQASSDQHFRSL